MMIDFRPLANGNWTALQEIAATLDNAGLQAATNALYDHIETLISECTDADVVFQPVDEQADDPVAASADEANIAWTLGHVIAHLTASCEESAALSAEQARGVEYHGRSRSEVDWRTITTIAQARTRLAESRRMCLAGLAMWPDTPDLSSIVEVWPNGPRVDARGRYLLGLSHADSHLGQIREIITQARS